MSRPQKPFWQRRKPSKRFDIAMLRPARLKRGQRFETFEDVLSESNRSQQALESAGHRLAAEHLDDCQSGAYTCEKSFCPTCARNFRRWFIGQLLKHQRAANQAVVVTLLLDAAKRGRLAALHLKNYRSLLRKRLGLSFGRNVVVLGCFEVVYKASRKQWILHVNLLVIDADEAGLKKFRSLYRDSPLHKPFEQADVVDPPKQLSYIPKFSTYHRPGIQSGTRRRKAKPLNPREHGELVNWMDRYRFEDFMFLRGCRRHKDEITLND